MQVLRSFLFVFLAGFVYSVNAQQLNLPAPPVTVINKGLSDSRYEFSGLAKWHNKILLVPQNRKHVIDSVFMIDSSAIEAFLQNKIPTPYTAFHFNNLKHVGADKDSLYIDNMLLDHYDGIEAAVVKGDTIFFSLETDTSFGYLVKGIIDEKAGTIHMQSDSQHIPNTYAIRNAGYESLGLLPGKDAVIAFFECNKDTLAAKAYMFNTKLNSKPVMVEWERPLYFRLSDVYALNDSELIAINHLFVNYKYPSERDAYINCLPLSIVEKQLTNGGNIDTCFTQIIKLTLKNNKLNWQPVAFISLDDKDNYEGIVPFKNGVLMIVDGEPGNNLCKMVYVQLK